MVTASVAAVLLALATVAFSKAPDLMAAAPFWQTTDDGAKFDFGAYVDSLEGEFDVETRGNRNKGCHYSTMYFGVGDRWGQIETCRTEDKFVATYLKVYDMDFEECFRSEVMTEDFTESETAPVESLEGNIVMTKEMFDDFVRITSDAKDRVAKEAQAAQD